jgi:drug/metabolite transporter (DMT)-like permease
MIKAGQYKISIAGFLITLLGAILFSTKAIMVKLAFGHTHTDALTLLTLRMIFALPFYVVAAFWVSGQKSNKQMTGKEWMLVLALGIFGYYLSSLFDFIGLQYVSAGLERLILFLYPTFAVLINAYFFKQKISNIQKFYFGSFMIFLCAITYSIYIAGSGRVIPLIGANKFTAYAMLAATAGIFIHFAIQGNIATLESGSSLWVYAIVLAVVATVVPSFLVSQGLKKIGSNNVAIISGIGPVSTIMQAHFILGEKIFAEQIIGTILVIIGVLLIGWRRKPVAETA